MPEMPEVTVISEDVAALALGREVLRAAVFRPDVTNVDPEAFGRRLLGKTLQATGRRGKMIVLEFGDVVGPVVLAFTRLWLGYFDLYEPGDENEHSLVSRLGPDPFSEEFT